MDKFNNLTINEIINKLLILHSLLRHFKYIKKRRDYVDEYMNGYAELSQKANEYSDNRFINSGHVVQTYLYDIGIDELNDNYYHKTTDVIDVLNENKETITDEYITQLDGVINSIDDLDISIIDACLDRYANNESDNIYIRLGLDPSSNDINKTKAAILRQFILNDLYEVFNSFSSEKREAIFNSIIRSDLPIYNDNLIFSNELYQYICGAIKEKIGDDINIDNINIYNNDN